MRKILPYLIILVPVLAISACADFVDNTNEIIESVGNGTNEAVEGANEGAEAATEDAK